MNQNNSVKFDGITYDPAQDEKRLCTQLRRVFYVVVDGRWRTIQEIQAKIETDLKAHDSESGISARLRDLRKERFGAYDIQRRRRENTNGVWEYRMNIYPKEIRQEKLF
jgi:hypothetical protein